MRGDIVDTRPMADPAWEDLADAVMAITPGAIRVAGLTLLCLTPLARVAHPVTVLRLAANPLN